MFWAFRCTVLHCARCRAEPLQPQHARRMCAQLFSLGDAGGCAPGAALVAAINLCQLLWGWAHLFCRVPSICHLQCFLRTLSPLQARLQRPDSSGGLGARPHS